MNCPHCGEEIVYEDVNFCPKCGNPFGSQSKRAGYVLAAAILTFVASAFAGGMGYIAIYQYISLVSLYDFSLIFGFLIFGIFGLIASAFAIVGATFMLKSKFIIISMLGVILLLVSVFVTYMTIEQFKYGYTDTLIFSQISIVILSILSTILVSKSRNEFAQAMQ